MKYLVTGLLLLVCSVNLQAQSQPLSVMSYNIRCGSCEAIENPNNWKKRKYLVGHLIKMHNPDIIGLQEAELFQVEDLIEMLDDYSWVGVGRDDGQNKGETTAILFRHARFTLQAQQSLWLSQTPNQPSRGWDAAYRRTLTIAKLLDVQAQQPLYIFNTHLDNEGEMARQEGAKLLLAELAKLDTQTPVFMTGDFNSKADSKTHEILTGALKDAEKISTKPAIGGTKTYTGFGTDNEPDNKIDFIFVNGRVKVSHHTIDTTTYNGLYPSDHYPVIIRSELLPKDSVLAE